MLIHSNFSCNGDTGFANLSLPKIHAKIEFEMNILTYYTLMEFLIMLTIFLQKKMMLNS